MIRFRSLPNIALGLAILASATGAYAKPPTIVNQFVSAQGISGKGPFGTITVTEVSGGLDFNLDLAPGYEFTPDDAALLFNLVAEPGQSLKGLSVSDLTAGFSESSTIGSNGTPSGSDYSGGAFGKYDFKITDDGSGRGGGQDDLSFLLTDKGKNLTFYDLRPGGAYGGMGDWFVSDIITAADCNAGRFGQGGSVAAAPEPTAWVLMLFGVVGTGAMLRRQRPLEPALS